MTQRLPFVIRPAAVDDAEALSPLIAELGYAMDPAALRQQWQRLQGSPLDQVYVAVGGGDVVACMALHATRLLHTERPLGRITTLVVASAWRGQGVGTALLRSARDWFERQGCRRTELTSGEHRHAAHRFYQQHGYAIQGKRFTRQSDDEREPRR